MLGVRGGGGWGAAGGPGGVLGVRGGGGVGAAGGPGGVLGVRGGGVGWAAGGLGGVLGVRGGGGGEAGQERGGHLGPVDVHTVHTVPHAHTSAHTYAHTDMHTHMHTTCTPHAHRMHTCRLGHATTLCVSVYYPHSPSRLLCRLRQAAVSRARAWRSDLSAACM